MVFVPFTGVDNHKRCITFGAGLLTKEDADSYSWLLEKFVCAMGKRPLCVVTDQDLAMQIAIKRVLPECRHRYCMWHIMTKVNEKLGSELAKDNEFRKKLLMDDYNLSTHRWFCKILVEFYMQFESVLGTQRYRQDKLNAKCEGYLPEFKTPLELERHIAQLFTITIFYKLQKEIEAACFYCSVVGVRETGTALITTLMVSAPIFRPCTTRGLPSDGDKPTPAATQLWTEINMCIGLVGNSLERQTRMVAVLQGLTAEFASDGISVNPVKGNRAAIQALCGVDPSQSITIQAPTQAKNKGTEKRIKSSRELAIEKNVKHGRKCGICGKYTRHNARSCPSK
ncbi:PREDICTED: protein FAR1-RELATED SEQUENCE 5-like [Ipomoea nil]|uniref:protein FAR1-RELATED SEQUENCE 5-like n=1 Tax=Ipomoea nil TaxID=35883 RepID=UPI0009011CB1|nr:PREDICTED: protein FAR1-RELATED SEQUENCE 5-like [Ipomoea nil]